MSEKEKIFTGAKRNERPKLSSEVYGLSQLMKDRLLSAQQASEDHMNIPGMPISDAARSMTVPPNMFNDAFQRKIVRDIVEMREYSERNTRVELAHTRLYLDIVYSTFKNKREVPNDLYCNLTFAVAANNTKDTASAIEKIVEEYGKFDKTLYTFSKHQVEDSVDPENSDDLFEDDEVKFFNTAIQRFYHTFGNFSDNEVTKLVYILFRHAEETNGYLVKAFVNDAVLAFLGVNISYEDIENFVMSNLFFTNRINKFKTLSSLNNDRLLLLLQKEILDTARKGLVFNYSYTKEGKISNERAYEIFHNEIGSKCDGFFPNEYEEFMSDNFLEKLKLAMLNILSEKKPIESREQWNMISILLYFYSYMESLDKLPDDYELKNSSYRKVDITHRQIIGRLNKNGSFVASENNDQIFYTKIDIDGKEIPLILQVANPKSKFSAAEKIMRDMRSSSLSSKKINDTNRLRIALPFDLRESLSSEEIEDLCLASLDTLFLALNAFRRSVSNIKKPILNDSLTTNSFSLGVSNYKCIFELDGSPVELQIAFDFPDHNHNQYKARQFKYNRPENVREEIFGSINYLYKKYCHDKSGQPSEEDFLRFQSVLNIINTFYIFPNTARKLDEIIWAFDSDMKVDLVGLSEPEAEDMVNLSLLEDSVAEYAP